MGPPTIRDSKVVVIEKVQCYLCSVGCAKSAVLIARPALFFCKLSIVFSLSCNISHKKPLILLGTLRSQRQLSSVCMIPGLLYILYTDCTVNVAL
jgi:hypothetical protein